MAKPKNHPDKQAAGSGKDSDSASYRTIGIIFLVAGLAMAIPESTRASGLPFIILGFTFLVIGQSDSSQRKK